jgi:hypothetical protein
VELEEEREEREDELAEKVERDPDPEVAKELGKKLVDEEEPDDGHFVEKILDHLRGGRRSRVQGEVRGAWAGQGPLVLDEHMMESAPEMVAEYEEEEEMEGQRRINERRGKKIGKERRRKDWGGKMGGNVAQDAINAIKE